MSWSIQAFSITAQNVEHELNQAAEKAIANGAGGPDAQRETAEQMTAIGLCAIDAVQSGLIGKGPFTVALSGHANPEHKPREGWSNDYAQMRID